MRGRAWTALVPSLLALAVHAPVLTHGLLWDDSVILGRQIPALSIGRILVPPSGIAHWTYHYYRPVVLLSFLFDHTLYGLDPVGYHATVWLLHAVATFGVFLLAARLLDRTMALLAACLFAVFPAHVESVGWIAGRNDVLAGLFAVFAAAVFVRGLTVAGPKVPPGRGATARPPAASGARGKAPAPTAGARGAGTRPWILAGSLLLLALLSKESAIALVPWMLGAALLYGARGRRLAAALVTSAAPVLVYVSMRVLLNGHRGEEALVQSAGSSRESIVWAAAYFPVRLIVPFLGSPYRLAPPTGMAPAIGLILLTAAAIALGIWSVRTRRIAIALGILWVASGLAAASLAAAWAISRTPVADRYLYMPAIGWCILVSACLTRDGLRTRLQSPQRQSERANGNPRVRESAGPARSSPAAPGVLGAAWMTRAAIAAGWALVALFAAVTIVRSRVYANETSFWTAATAAEPDSGAARMNLGNALYAAGDLEGASGAYRRALQLQITGADRALALTNLGAVLYQTGDRVQAEALLRQAASLPGADATAAFNLGAMLYQKGYAAQAEESESAHRVFGEARAQLERAVAMDAYHARAWMLLGLCYAEAGLPDRARAAWNRVLALEGPESAAGRDASAALSRTSPGNQPNR